MMGAAAGRRWHVDSLESIFYASAWFIATQVLLIGALYAFAQVDWKALFDQHKLAWLTLLGLSGPSVPWAIHGDRMDRCLTTVSPRGVGKVLLAFSCARFWG
jgi:hypothetical protein